MNIKNKEDMEDFLSMTQAQKNDHCDWCWRRTCYRCYSCPIHAERVGRKIEKENSNEK